MPNLYTPSLGGMDPQTARVIRDLADRVNYLTTELDAVRGGVPGFMTTRAEKENPQPGIITIPSDGQDGFIRVSKDGVIHSYTNPGNSIFPYVDISTKGNITTGLDVLHTFTMPAGTLAFDGDALWLRYGGTFATNDNDKRINLFFGGQSVHNTGLFDVDIGTWSYDMLYVRISPTSIRVPWILGWNFANRDGAGTLGGNFILSTETVTVGSIPNMNTNDTVIEVRAEGTATNDIQQTISFINRYKISTLVTT